MSRRSLAQVFDCTGALDAVLRARARGRTSAPWLTVLTYHRIHSNPDTQAFDRGVIDATPMEFDAQLGMLRRYFNVVGLEELFAHQRGATLPPNPAIVTFDDGYKECYACALPLLLKHGLKAAFFIATSYLTERRIFWWDRISYVVRASNADRIRLEYPFSLELDIAATRERAIGQLLRVVKCQPALDLDRFLSGLTSACGVAWDSVLERAYADQLLMTWDEVRAMQSFGMEIHSHTRTHRVLQTLPIGDLDSELAGARRDLEEQVGRPVRGISYPVGRSISSSPLIRAAVSRAGYDLGFSNTSGVTVLNGSVDPLDMHRISVERSMPSSYFKALLALPSFAECAV